MIGMMFILVVPRMPPVILVKNIECCAAARGTAWLSMSLLPIVAGATHRGRTLLSDFAAQLVQHRSPPSPAQIRQYKNEFGFKICFSDLGRD